MERKNIAAFTESTSESFPGFVSINRWPDGKIMLTARARGHRGEKVVSVEIPQRDLYDLAVDTLENIGGPL